MEWNHCFRPLFIFFYDRCCSDVLHLQQVFQIFSKLNKFRWNHPCCEDTGREHVLFFFCTTRFKLPIYSRVCKDSCLVFYKLLIQNSKQRHVRNTNTLNLLKCQEMWVKKLQSTLESLSILNRINSKTSRWFVPGSSRLLEPFNTTSTRKALVNWR